MEPDAIIKPERKTKKKEPSLRVVKYHKARLQGHNKEESKRIAGYSPNTLTTTIENSDTYKRISVADTLRQVITLEEIAARHAEIIRSGKDADSNAAIKLAYERIEPENKAPEQAERVIVVLK